MEYGYGNRFELFCRPKSFEVDSVDELEWCILELSKKLCYNAYHLSSIQVYKSYTEYRKVIISQMLFFN